MCSAPDLHLSSPIEAGDDKKRRPIWRHAAIGFLIASAISCPAAAQIADSAPNGFSVVETAHIAAAPDKVWAELIQPSRWWSAEHSYSGKAANFTLEPRAGGGWCEALPNGAVQHMTVVYADAGKRLVLRGALGPLQTMGADGAMSIDLKPAAGGGTDLTLTFNAGGYLKGGLDHLAAPVDMVLGQQVARLKADVETGSPQASSPEHPAKGDKS